MQKYLFADFGGTRASGKVSIDEVAENALILFPKPTIYFIGVDMFCCCGEKPHDSFGIFLIEEVIFVSFVYYC